MLKYTENLSSNFHDIRGDITGISSSLDDLKEFILNNNQEDLIHFMKLIKDSIKNINKTWDDIVSDLDSQMKNMPNK